MAPDPNNQIPRPEQVETILERLYRLFDDLCMTDSAELLACIAHEIKAMQKEDGGVAARYFELAITRGLFAYKKEQTWKSS